MLRRERRGRRITGLEGLGVLQALRDGTLSEGPEAREGAVLAVVVELDGALLHIFIQFSIFFLFLISYMNRLSFAFRCKTLSVIDRHKVAPGS